MDEKNVFSQMDFGPLSEFLEQDDVTDVSYSNSGQVWLKTLSKGVYQVERPAINNAFMEKGIVNNIILNYNPFVLNKGIPLFKGNYFENKLKLEKIVREQEDIVQVHYSVIN